MPRWVGQHREHDLGRRADRGGRADGLLGHGGWSPIQFRPALRRRGVLSERARPSFPRVALATTRRETRRPMTSKTTTAGSDTDRQAILDVLAGGYQAWEAKD